MSENVLALLRGINVGGRAKIPMTDLKEALAAAGLGDVRSHLQTGNLIVSWKPGDRATLVDILGETIKETFDLGVKVIVRARAEVSDVVDLNPLAAPATDASKWHVVFLETAPDQDRIERLDPDRSPRDRFTVSGKEIFIHYGDASGRSKLSLDYFERVLGVSGTARNWNTVTRLLEMLED